MSDMLLTGGNTPFERIAKRHHEGSLRLATAYATTQIIKVIEECDIQITDYFKIAADIRSAGSANTPELSDALVLATQALKDKKVAESALKVLMENAATNYGEQ